jgi:L-ascorbate metabolism protein UlaG (beta-lactamase superfamily)
LEIKDVSWIGHASFMIKGGGMNIFIDPVRVPEGVGKGDLLLLTHPHHDHFSPDDIEKVVKAGTRIICAQGTLTNEYPHVTVVKPGAKHNMGPVQVETVPAYNFKSERLNFHPMANGWVGFIITIDGKRIYHAGDTDFTDEVRGLKDIYLALLPSGGMYTMALDEAIDAARAIRAEHTAPMHYKAILGKNGSDELEKKFSAAVKGAVILKEIQEPRYSF